MAVRLLELDRVVIANVHATAEPIAERSADRKIAVGSHIEEAVAGATIQVERTAAGGEDRQQPRIGSDPAIQNENLVWSREGR